LAGERSTLKCFEGRQFGTAGDNPTQGCCGEYEAEFIQHSCVAETCGVELPIQD
jgi:hypothetical protein